MEKKMHVGVVPPDAPANLKPAPRQLSLEGEVPSLISVVENAIGPKDMGESILRIGGILPTGEMLLPKLVLKHEVALATLSPELREWYEERAAILEYDGKMSRKDAEDFALRLTMHKASDEI